MVFYIDIVNILQNKHKNNIMANQIKTLNGNVILTYNGSIKDVDLSHRDLSNADLKDMDLSGCNLQGADFSYAN